MDEVKLSKKEFRKIRTVFEKNLLKAVASQMKGINWKKAQNVIFCEKSDYYYSVSIDTFTNDEKTKLTFSVKPMNIDPLFWDIMNMTENEKEPLSFRTWGAFTCSEIPTEEKEILDGSANEQLLAEEIVSWADKLLEEFDVRYSEQKFSYLIKDHENQRERGAYSISLVTTLIAEGNLEEARKYASSYDSRELKSVSSMSSQGKSFHAHAMNWIDNRKSV